MKEMSTLDSLLKSWRRNIQAGNPFLFRVSKTKPDYLEIFEGSKIVKLKSVKDIQDLAVDGKFQCFMIPYSAIAEYGGEVKEDYLSPTVFTVDYYTKILISDTDRENSFRYSKKINSKINISPAVSDKEYERLIKYARDNLIRSGEGCNFVFRRDFIANFPSDVDISEIALSCFLGIFSSKDIAFWNYAWFDGRDIVVGASPEPLLSVREGIARMTPISGTFRGAMDSRTLEEFLLDEKEIFELNMVLDEELKIMSRICRSLVRVDGPKLIKAGDILHTSFSIEGRLSANIGEALLRTLGAPTVVGIPILAAQKHVYKLENSSRKYYSGTCGVMYKNHDGDVDLESALVIRSIEFEYGNNFGKISAGSTIVQKSNEKLEVIEVNSKIISVANLMGVQVHNINYYPNEINEVSSEPYLANSISDCSVKRIIKDRALAVPHVWKDKGVTDIGIRSKILLLECGDNFIWMISYILERNGYKTSVVNWAADLSDEYIADYDCIILGPGPGDPKVDDTRSASIIRYYEYARTKNVAVCAVCLSHQIIARLDGYNLKKISGKGFQGRKKKFKIDNEEQIFATYNSYQVIDHDDITVLDYRKKNGFRSFQWHPESILSERGDVFLVNEIQKIIKESNNSY